MFRIAAFDMDGTIADTIPMCIKAFRGSVSPHAGHELSDEEILHTFGLNEIGMVKAVAGPNWKAAAEDFYVRYESMHGEVTGTFPGITCLLEFLKKKNVTLALITGKGERSCTITLEKLGLAGVFDEILFGSEISPNKIENMEYLLRKYDVSPNEFCYIGDTVRDIRDCRKAGVACFSAAWQESADADSLEKENPGRVFDSVNGLYGYFNRTW